MEQSRLPRWHSLLFGVRTRILAAYGLLILLSTVIATLVIRHALLVRLQEQIEGSLRQEVEEFRLLEKGPMNLMNRNILNPDHGDVTS